MYWYDRILRTLVYRYDRNSLRKTEVPYVRGGGGRDARSTYVAVCGTSHGTPRVPWDVPRNPTVYPGIPASFTWGSEESTGNLWKAPWESDPNTSTTVNNTVDLRQNGRFLLLSVRKRLSGNNKHQVGSDGHLPCFCNDMICTAWQVSLGQRSTKHLNKRRETSSMAPGKKYKTQGHLDLTSTKYRL